MTDAEGTIRVEVCFALPDRQFLKEVLLPAGATVGEAIERSGVCGLFPEADPATNRVGIFGVMRTPADPLEDGDRVEIYRPLRADPKDIRRRRAGKAQG